MDRVGFVCWAGFGRVGGGGLWCGVGGGPKTREQENEAVLSV
jgi:hypothetical protein